MIRMKEPINDEKPQVAPRQGHSGQAPVDAGSAGRLLLLYISAPVRVHPILSASKTLFRFIG
jgi:hypothetical protein